MLTNTVVFTLLLIIIKSLISAKNITTKEEVIDYLQHFGYINESKNAITDFENDLVQFQEMYNLPVDGTLNKPTMLLINKPRCSFSENAFTIKSKWNKKHLKWYFLKHKMSRNRLM